MGTRFPRNNFWDLLGGQVLVMIGQWYPWQTLFSVAPKACTHTPESLLILIVSGIRPASSRTAPDTASDQQQVREHWPFNQWHRVLDGSRKVQISGWKRRRVCKVGKLHSGRWKFTIGKGQDNCQVLHWFRYPPTTSGLLTVFESGHFWLFVIARSLKERLTLIQENNFNLRL